jgi:hypothetical protein
VPATLRAKPTLLVCGMKDLVFMPARMLLEVRLRPAREQRVAIGD